MLRGRGILRPVTEVVEVKPLTADEDSFALAVIEYGGNLPAAYKSVFGDVKSPTAKATAMVSRPEIALRIKELNDLTQEHALISLGSHLQQLSKIRDLAIDSGDLRTGLNAEVQRGTVAGYYKDAAKAPTDGAKFVQINIQNNTPGNLQEWGKQFGNTPVVIENDG